MHVYNFEQKLMVSKHFMVYLQNTMWLEEQQKGKVELSFQLCFTSQTNRVLHKL